MDKNTVLQTVADVQTMEKLFKFTAHQIVTLELRWKMFLDLFDTGEENARLTNDAADLFFANYYRMAIENVMSIISRLTDPPFQGGFKNASIELIIKELKSFPTFDQTTLDPHISVIARHRPYIQTVRNKALAHFDHDTMLNIIPPPPIFLKEYIFEVIVSIKTIHNLGASTLGYEELKLDDEISYSGGSSSLLRRLREAKMYRQLSAEGKAPYLA